MLQIITAGQFNFNQGPDFLNARIRIDNTILAGNIELHLEEEGWRRHAHQHDPNYKNIILHVLWDPPRQPQLALPTIALKDRVPKILLLRYQELMKSKAFVPCAQNVHDAGSITWRGWKERLLAERLLRKSAQVQQYLEQSHYHWEEVFWWMLARNFGIPVNADAFEAVARSVTLKILAKHRNNLLQLEALLLGQAGLLDEVFEDPYAAALAREYRFLKMKYGFHPIHLPVHFLRMRPRNFPTVRFAQLAMLVHTISFPFSTIRESDALNAVRQLLTVTPGEFWDTHYMLREAAAFNKKTAGQQMTDNIIINTIAPMLFAYGHLKQEQQYKDKAIDWLEQLPAERNVITGQWETMGISGRHAGDSQALLELKKEYCDAKRCLECAVGNHLLRSGQHQTI